MPPDKRPADSTETALDAARDALADAREAMRRAERAVREAEEVSRQGGGQDAPQTAAEWTWKARLWACPAETRLAVEELAESLDRSPSWVYQRTRSDAADPIPHRKLAGRLTFLAGEIRHWIRTHETAPVQGPSWSPADGGLGVVEEVS